MCLGNSTAEIEAGLVTRAKSGDRDAFSILIRQHLPRVHRAANAILHNRDDADDVAQETFVRAYQSINRFDERRPLLPWLYRIARNLSLNRVQRVNNREVTEPDFANTTGRSRGPEEAALRREELMRVRLAVASLPDQHREIIELSHFQECSYQEISEILEIPIGTVMSRLYNARQKLKKVLAESNEVHR